MVFSSHVFIFYFLPTMLLAYYGLCRAPQKWRNLLLAVLGYVFYGWANPKFIFLMFGTTFVDWFLSLVIAADSWRISDLWRLKVTCLPPMTPEAPRTQRQRTALLLSLISNLTMLAFFKYFNFGIDSYNSLVKALGLEAWHWDTFFRVVLPLGISFYTFQSLSYIIDVYRGDAKAMKSFRDFSCFVSMCPHLVAGPILKFSVLAEQIESRMLTVDKFARGCAFFAMGLGKKILLANPMGEVADAAFSAGALDWHQAWAGVGAYAFQIYFDFSGYSDMAIGLGLMLGFNFSKNFDSPYKSASITEFWQRWHISLSNWLRDYLYIPLGGNRKGNRRTYINLMLTMLLGGLWHGASWNFVIWGGIQGSMLAGERAMGKDSLYRRAPRFVRVAVTFAIILFSWVFFRAADLSSSMRYIGHMVGFGGGRSQASVLSGVLYDRYHLIMFAVCGLVVWGCKQTWDHAQRITLLKVAGLTALFAWAVAVMWTQSYNPFIYFVF